MLSKLLGLFARKPAIVEGTAKLAEGHAKRVAFGDPLAGGKEVVLCRVGGALHALDRHCPHDEGGRIADGPLIDGQYAMCPLHGYKFDPRSGRAAGVPCADAKTYRVREADGRCEIWL
jgi:nitrite reductase/ring-hydroxylating ferredoxin subunit